MKNNRTNRRSLMKKTGIMACILALVIGLCGCVSGKYESGVSDPFDGYSTIGLPDIRNMSLTMHLDDGTIMNFGIIYQNTVPLAYISEGIMDHQDTDKYVMTDDEFDRLRYLIKVCNAKKWDGYDKTDSSVSEGEGYDLTFKLRYTDDTTVTAYGHNTMPKGFERLLDGISWLLNNDSLTSRFIEIGTLHLNTLEGNWFTATKDMKLTIKDNMMIQSYLNATTGQYDSVFATPVRIESNGVFIDLDNKDKAMFDYDYIQFRNGLIYACYKGDDGQDYEDIYAREGQEGLLPIQPVYANARKGVADNRISYFSLILNHAADFADIPLFAPYEEDEDLLYIYAKTIDEGGQTRLEVVINIYDNPKVVLLNEDDSNLFREIVSSEAILGYNQYNDLGDNDPDADNLFLDIRFASREIVEVTALDGRAIDDGLVHTLLSLIGNGEPYEESTVNRRVPQTWKCQCGSLNFAFFNVCNRCGRERPVTE